MLVQLLFTCILFALFLFITLIPGGAPLVFVLLIFTCYFLVCMIIVQEVFRALLWGVRVLAWVVGLVARLVSKCRRGWRRIGGKRKRERKKVKEGWEKRAGRGSWRKNDGGVGGGVGVDRGGNGVKGRNAAGAETGARLPIGKEGGREKRGGSWDDSIVID
ncbi:hypothetical protein ONS96_002760 [Cadophora gregata f. sp. sojae]|nr:hypothetical protein ONS96_002760 [Cadophora gregata f. sp. sojae]